MTTRRRLSIVALLLVLAAVVGYCYSRPRCEKCEIHPPEELQLTGLRSLELVQAEIRLRLQGQHGTSEFAQSLRRFSTDQLIAAVFRARAIYGDDNRVDPADRWFIARGVRRNVEATVAMVHCAHFTPGCTAEAATVYELAAPANAQTGGLCCQERFSQQVSLASCTGFLIAPNKVATARHCVKTNEQLGQLYFVFGFAKSFFGKIPTRYVHRETLFKPVAIHRSCPDDNRDWAIVTLDHDVPPDHEPVSLGDGKPGVETELYSLGHPFGLPVKYTSNAFVRPRGEDNFFVANLDGLDGSSGSPVFDAATHRVQGIWVRGEKTLADTSCACKLPLPCPADQCKGEEVSRIHFLGKEGQAPDSDPKIPCRSSAVVAPHL